MDYEIEYFQKKSGRIPVREFLDSLDKTNRRLQARIFRDLSTLERLGVNLGMPAVRLLGKGLYELRSSVGTDIARVFYFFFDGKKIILINGFVKKTQKTPPGELEKARRYKREYEENHE